MLIYILALAMNWPHVNNRYLVVWESNGDTTAADTERVLDRPA